MAKKVRITWTDKQDALDPENPTADEQLISTEINETKEVVNNNRDAFDAAFRVESLIDNKTVTVDDAGRTYFYDGSSDITITSDHIPFNVVVRGTGKVNLSLTGAPTGLLTSVAKLPESDGIAKIMLDQADSYVIMSNNKPEPANPTVGDHFGSRLIDEFVMANAVVTTGSDIDSVEGTNGNVLLPVDTAAKPVLDIDGYAVNDGTKKGLEVTFSSAPSTVSIIAVGAQSAAATEIENVVLLGDPTAEYRSFRINNQVPELSLKNTAGTFKSNAFAATMGAGDVAWMYGTYTEANGISGRYKDSDETQTLTNTGADRNTSPQSKLNVGLRTWENWEKFKFKTIIIVNGALSDEDIKFLDTHFGI